MASTAEEAARLVREAAAVLADDMTSAGFAISYGSAESVLFEQVLDLTNHHVPKDRWNVTTTDDQVLWTETLTTNAFGVATVIVAARTAGHLVGERSEEFEVREELDQLPGWQRAFYGLAYPNPSFLYRSVDELQLMLRVPDDAGLCTPDDGMRIGDSLLLAQTVAELASTAADRGLPLLVVQSPMAPPPSRDDDSWPLAQVPGVRCAIALSSRDVASRIEIYKAVHTWAHIYGLRLYIGDRRADSRRGSWQQVSDGDRRKYEANIGDLPRAGTVVTRALPATFVGPARPGTTAQIMAHLATHKVPVLSMSVTPLENQAFITLLVGLMPAQWVMASGLRGTAAEVVAELELLGLSAGNPSTRHRRARDAVSRDYRGCVGWPVSVTPLDRNQRALWATWQFPEETGAPRMAVAQLRQALTLELGEHEASVQYVICRRGNAQDLRGLCKLSVPAESHPAADDAGDSYARTELCRRIESRWRTLLGRGAPRSIIDVDVTWDESRLGRWLSPPGGARRESGPDELRGPIPAAAPETGS